MAKQRILVRGVLVFLPMFFVFFWLLRPAFLGQLGGTFRAREIPEEYIIFKDFIAKQPDFFRIFWVPQKQRFGFSSYSHPAMAMSGYMEDKKCLEPFCRLKMTGYDREYFGCHPEEKCFPADASFLVNPETSEILKGLSVKYVVIPYDSEREIFLEDRKYDFQQRLALEKELDQIPWLKKITLFKKIAVWELN